MAETMADLIRGGDTARCYEALKVTGPLILDGHLWHVGGSPGTVTQTREPFSQTLDHSPDDELSQRYGYPLAARTSPPAGA